MRSRLLVIVMAQATPFATGRAQGQEAAAEVPPQPLSPQPPLPRPLLMEGFDALGAGATLRDWRIDFNGWIEQSYSANTQQPDDNRNALHAFDDRANAYRFNQAVVAVQRTLADGNGFDVGGRVELLYGTDGALIHAAGLRPGDQDATLQFDPVEFYFTLRLPLGEGLALKAGKFTTPIGSEVIDAPANALYSHSFLFAFGTPLTHAGVSLSYPLTERASVAYALVRGWDVWIDDNDALSQIVSANWKSVGERLALTGNLMYGPEQKDDESHQRTLLDLIATYGWSERFSTSVNADVAYEQAAAADGGPGRWWGVATYATWKSAPRISYTTRAEYFVDRDGTRTGFTADLFELTLGATIFPFAATGNVRVRPEVRWDHAFGDDPFDDATRSDQFTFAVDLILSF